MKKSFFKISLLAALTTSIITLSGCATNPINDRDQINKELQQNPTSCRNNVLKSFSFLKDSNLYNISQLEIAAAGLHIATMHCPTTPELYMYLGLARYRIGNYFNAEDSFEKALIASNYQNRNALFMFGYIYSLIDIKDSENLALKDLLKEYGKPQLPTLVKRIAKQLQYIEKKENGSDKQKILNKNQLTIATAFILNKNTENTRSGINLLEGLQLQLSASQEWQAFNMDNWNRYIDVTNQSTNGSPSFASVPFTSASALSVSIPEIKYDANIFNNTTAAEEVISRPALLASYGSESKYFTGQGFVLGLNGSSGGTAAFDDDEIGITLDVTPTLVDDKTVKLVVSLTRDFIEPSVPASVTFDNVLPTGDNSLSTTITIPFGQTAILSALSSNSTSNTNSKVPVLGNIPIVGKLFNKKTTGLEKDNIIIFLTPTPYYLSAQTVDYSELEQKNREFRAYLNDLSKQLEPIDFVHNFFHFGNISDYVANNIIKGMMQEDSMMAVANKLPY